MAESTFRYRGVRVVIDTTEGAELSIKGYQIGDAALERIGRKLQAAAFLPSPRDIGDIRVREIDGYDIVFIIGKERDTVVITIGAVEVPDPENPIENVLKTIGTVDMFRGAAGI